MPVPFARFTELCATEGLEAVATIAVPERLDPAGLDQLLADGIGDMNYLAEHRELRLQPGLLAPDSRCVGLVLLPHASEAEDGRLRRARYAAGKDYHRLLRQKLARIGRQLAEEAGITDPGRATVDSAPVNERTLARLAGLGWLGKNALLLHPKRGSYHFIGCLFTPVSLELRAGGQGEDRCGSCTACEEACPTRALVDRRVLSTRCISYLTIEHQGIIARELAEHFQGWWFGCDICQEVCPWNRFARPPGDGRLAGQGDAEAELLGLDAEGFDRYFAGRAVRRIGYARFRRNLLVALWSLDRQDPALAGLLAEGLPLVLRQASELGLAS